MTDQQFRASVRADAIRAGNPPDVADWLAKRVGEQPTEFERKRFGGDARVRSVTMSAPPRARTVDQYQQQMPAVNLRRR